MSDKVIGIVLLLIGVLILYMFLFWVIKQISPIIYEHDQSDKQSQRGIFWGFVLYSGFIIVPSYAIVVMIIKIIELIYN